MKEYKRFLVVFRTNFEYNVKASFSTYASAEKFVKAFVSYSEKYDYSDNRISYYWLEIYDSVEQEIVEIEDIHAVDPIFESDYYEYNHN